MTWAWTPDVWPHVRDASLAGLAGFTLTFVLTPLMRSLAVRVGWVAKPLEDRWGKRVTARLGGVAMFAGFLVPVWIWAPKDQAMIGLLLGASLSFALGLIDDFRRIRPYTKLLGQLFIGCVVVMSGFHIDLIPWTWLSIPVSVMWLVLVMNAFNLLDNMDGLAAGTGALAAAFCACHAVLGQQWSVVPVAVVLCGICLGFLRFNFYPAKIYMGDSGSHFLGLSLSALALLGTWRHSTQLVSVLAVPVLVLAVPIFDTCFVTIQRLSHRQHPFVGGRDHISHRLAILGLSVPQTVMVLYGVSASLGLLSIVSVTLQPFSAAAMWLVALTLLLLLGSYLAHVNVYRLEPPSFQANDVSGAASVTFIETMLLHKRRLVEVLVDFALISSAYVCATLLRFEGVLTPARQQLMVQSLPIILVVKLACFAGCGMYRGLWRYLGLADVITVFKAVTLGSVLSTVALVYLWRFEGYSRSVVVIDWMLLLFAVGGSRIVERFLDEWIRNAGGEGIPSLIIGAGDTGVHVLQSLRLGGKEKRRIVGFLDDDLRKQGSRLQGHAVLGTRADLARLLEQHGVREVFIAINDPPGQLLQHVQRCCEPGGVTWKVVTVGVTDTR